MPAPRRATAAPSAMPEPRHPSPWRLAADRGGTFTDCAALTPSGEFKRCKVLSSGILRARIAALAGPQSCRPDRSWDVPDGCFVGWQIRFADGPPATITSWQNATLSWDRPDLTPAPGDVLELSTGEPAPVVGARLLTGTPLAPVMARFVADIRSAMGPEVSLRFLTSAGGLAPADSFRPCDSLLSGPAGGVAGAAAHESANYSVFGC